MLKYRFLVLLVFWFGLITTLSLIELKVKETPNINQVDKIVHFLFHYILSLLLLFHLKYDAVFIQVKRIYYFVFFFSLIYGVLIEVLQSALPVSRDSDFFDVLANTFGCSVALLSFSYFLRLKRQ